MADAQDIEQSLNTAVQFSAAIRNNIGEASAEARRMANSMSMDFARLAEESDDLFNSTIMSKFVNMWKTLRDRVKEVAAQIKKASPAMLALTGGIGGLTLGFGLAKTAVTAFGGALNLLFNVGRNVVGALTKTFGLFFSFFMNAMHSDGGGGELFEALQEIRRQFGALEDDTAQAIFGVVDILRTLPRNLEGVGLHLADIVKSATEYATTLGPLFMGFFMNEFTANSAIFRKGLGMTDDQFKQLVRDSRAMGESFDEVSLGIARNAGAIGAAVGVSQKVIAMEMMKARSNIAAFGDLTDEEIGLAVGRFQSLGLEVENVLGLFEKFNTFESAAETVSQLSAAFGVQLDVFRMVNEENPAEALDEVRRQFIAAGRSVETFSRRELQLLGSTLGMDESMVRLALSTENAGLSMEEISAKAEASGEKTKSLEEVMVDLTAAIARLRGSGQQFNSFMEAMAAGVNGGIERFLRYNGVLRAYRRSLRETYLGFRELTRVVLEAFPGLESITEALKRLWNPDFIRDQINLLQTAMVDLVKSGGEDFATFQERIAEIFNNIFGEGSDVMASLKEGGLIVLRVLGNIIRGALEGISEMIFGDPVNGLAGRLLTGFTTALTSLAGWLTRGEVDAALGRAGDFASSVGGGIIGPIVEFFKSEQARAAFSAIWTALKDVIMTAVETADSYFKELSGMLMDKFFGGMFTDAEGRGPGMVGFWLMTLFGPAVVGGALGLATKSIFALVGGIGSLMQRAFRSRAVTAPIAASISEAVTAPVRSALHGPRMGRAGASIGESARAARAARAAAAAAATAPAIAAPVAATGAIPPPALWKGALAIGVLAVVIGTVIYQLVKNLNALEVDDPEELRSKIISTSILVGALSLATVAVGALGALYTGPQAAAVPAGLIALGVVATGLGVGVGAMLFALNHMGDIKPSTISILGILPDFLMGVSAIALSIAGLGLISMTGVGAIGIVVGLETVSFVISEIKGAVVSIVKDIGSHFQNLTSSQIDATERGVGIVVQFLEGISPFLDSFASIMAATRPGFFRNQDAKTRAITAALDAMNQMMTSIAVGPDSAVATMLTNVKSLITGITPSEVAAISAIVPMFTMIGSFLAESSKAGEIMANANAAGWFDTAEENVTLSDSIIAGMRLMAGSTTRLLESGVPNAIEGIIRAIGDTEFTEAQINTLGAIAPLFEIVASLVSSFTQGGMSPRLRAVLAAGSEIDANTVNAMRMLGNTAPDLTGEITRLLINIGPAIAALMITIATTLNLMGNTSALEDKLPIIESILSSVGAIMQISGTIAERVTPTEGGLSISETIGMVGPQVLTPFSTLVGLIPTMLPSDTILNQAVARLDAIEESNVIHKLENFFENSGGLFEKIRSTQSGSGAIIDLGTQQINNIARILPAVAQAVQELEGARIVNDNLSIALQGTTFDITVILKVDGEELGRVAASHIYSSGG